MSQTDYFIELKQCQKDPFEIQSVQENTSTIQFGYIIGILQYQF